MRSCVDRSEYYMKYRENDSKAQRCNDSRGTLSHMLVSLRNPVYRQRCFRCPGAAPDLFKRVNIQIMNERVVSLDWFGVLLFFYNQPTRQNDNVPYIINEMCLRR